ncbi:unnamed protein product [Soboliphyme baturini]|uniref:GTP-binding protein Di-Ras2 n=1 Tax=Soboliphyme baturini TaxID=241478 RepID=A0A183J147_9BILA|nr:unnamed protein product [Soboliphyme baturini]
MPEQTNDYRVAVFGAGGVGKSSIVQRFVKGTFSNNYIPTIEDTFRQVISCNRNNVCTLHITDSTGSHQFPAMQRLSVSTGNAFILVYAITSKQSFDELSSYYDMIKEVKADDLADVPVMIVGNKLDEEEQREVPMTIAQSRAADWLCGFIETSAKHDVNVTELFRQLLDMEKRRKLSLNLCDGADASKKTQCCCILS